MDTARISALLEPFLVQPLSTLQLNYISMYIDILQRWNARINLTAIRKEEEIVTRHFGESLFLARHVFPALNQCHPERSHDTREARVVAKSKDPYTSSSPQPSQGVLPVQPTRVLDIGSGAGFPALPLKIWAPHLDLHLTLIESNHKKATFLREVTRALTLTDVNVISARAETVSAQAEVVTLRAVEHFKTILPQAQLFLAPKGTLALLIGASQSLRLQTQTKLTWNPPIPIPQSHARVLSIGVLPQSGTYY
jgi:16S rRNA (guanine527-N7)-methyltransferase